MANSLITVLKWVCGIAAALLVLLAAGGWYLFGGFLTAANSIEKLEDRLYAMEYWGDYGTEGMCLGLCLGTAIGASLGNHTGIGICLGMLIGLFIGTCIKKEGPGDGKKE